MIGADLMRKAKSAHRAVWALGDYPKVARDRLAVLGRALASAFGAGPGGRVPDIAAAGSELHPPGVVASVHKGSRVYDWK